MDLTLQQYQIACNGYNFIILKNRLCFFENKGIIITRMCYGNI